MRKIYISVILLTLLLGRFVYAEDILTWEECVRQAKKNHPDLVSASEKVKQAKADLDIDISGMSPQITSGASGKRGKTVTGKTKNTYSYDITGQQLIFDGFKTSSDISNALKTIQAQEYNYNVASSNIRLNLRNAFVGLLRAQDLTSLTEQIAERRKQNLELIELRYEAGREHRGSLLTSDADFAQAKFEVAQAQRSISLAQRNLSKELGLDKMRSLRVKGEYSIKGDYSLTPDIENLANTTPFLKELIAKKEAARYNLQSEKSDFFPEVYLNMSIGRTGSSMLPRDKEWLAGMSISFPLFEGGSRIAEVTKAKSQFDQAKAEERSGRDSVLVTLESTWKDLKDADANLAVKRKFLEAAEERAKITGAQYATGLVSFDDWVIIEDNLVNAKKNYLNAQANLLLTEAFWIQAIGGTLDYDEE